MIINFDDKEMLRVLNCLKIELNAKPNLMAKIVNNANTLVIVVDMINGFCKKGALASEDCNAISEDVARLLSMLPKAKKVFLRDNHSKDSVEFRYFPEHCATKKESAIIDELKGFDGLDVEKNSTNGFFRLIEGLPDLNSFSHILVVGVCTDICVMQLALTLKSYFNEYNNFVNVVTFTDCVQTYNSPIHNIDLMNMFSLKLMEQAGVQVFKNII